MSSPPRPRISVEEYLRLDRAAEIKSEYFDGYMYPVGEGPPPLPENPVARSIIRANLAAELRAALRHKGLVVGLKFASADIAVLAQSEAPVLLVEIPLPSTEAQVRSQKLRQHRSIESICGMLSSLRANPWSRSIRAVPTDG